MTRSSTSFLFLRRLPSKEMLYKLKFVGTAIGAKKRKMKQGDSRLAIVLAPRV